MQRKLKIILALISITAFSFFANAQKKVSEGKVIYELSFPDMELDAATASMMPSEMTIYFKDYLMRTEMNMGMGMSTVSISNGKEKITTVLTDIMGNKSAVKMTEADMEKQKSRVPKYEIINSDAAKEIAGYKCKRADIKSKDGDFSVWFTGDIAVKNSNWDSPFKGINGFLMEFVMNQGGMNMKLSAKNVIEEKVNDSMFTVPEGYKMTTPDEFKKMYGK